MSNNIFADQSDVFGDYYNCIETLGEDYIGKKNRYRGLTKGDS